MTSLRIENDFAKNMFEYVPWPWIMIMIYRIENFDLYDLKISVFFFHDLKTPDYLEEWNDLNTTTFWEDYDL